MASNPKDEPGSTMIAELHLVKVMDKTGHVYCHDLSQDNAGGELSEEERNDMIFWALGKHLMPYVISWVESTYGKKLAE